MATLYRVVRVHDRSTPSLSQAMGNFLNRDDAEAFLAVLTKWTRDRGTPEHRTDLIEIDEQPIADSPPVVFYYACLFNPTRNEVRAAVAIQPAVSQHKLRGTKDWFETIYGTSAEETENAARTLCAEMRPAPESAAETTRKNVA